MGDGLYSPDICTMEINFNKALLSMLITCVGDGLSLKDLSAFDFDCKKVLGTNDRHRYSKYAHYDGFSCTNVVCCTMGRK